MPRTADPSASGNRAEYVKRALRLVTLSVVFGLGSGAVSIATGLRGNSVGVFAVGLGVLADVVGSATLIWRFRAELSEPALSDPRERQSAVIVGLALAVIAVVLAVESAVALAQGSHPSASAVTITAACLSLVVLTPLAIAKRRLGRRMASQSLTGDGPSGGHRCRYQLPGDSGPGRVSAARLVVGRPRHRPHRGRHRRTEAWQTYPRRHF